MQVDCLRKMILLIHCHFRNFIEYRPYESFRLQLPIVPRTEVELVVTEA